MRSCIQDPVTNQGYFKGVSDVPGLYFEMQFPAKLERGEMIRIQASRGSSVGLLRVSNQGTAAA
eukprot:13271887-Alexandrium_andersonii.AAC.1